MRNMLRPLAAALVAALLWMIPAARADQSSVVLPVAGPMSMATFVGTYLNPGLQALFTCNSGNAAPTNGISGAPESYQCWWDTSTNPRALKWYDGTVWNSALTMDTSAHTISFTLSSGLRAVTGTTDTLQDADKGLGVTYTNASGVAVVLPQAGGVGQFLSGWFTDVQNIGAAGDITITPATSTIDGLTSIVLKPGQGIRLRSNGTNYSAWRGMQTVAVTCASSRWINVISTNLVPTCTQPAIGDVSGWGANVATFLGTPSSANLRAALTDETGTGAAVFASSPTIAAPTITGLTDFQGPLKLSTQTAPAQITADQNNYNPTSVVCTTSGTLLLNSDAARDITGLAGGAIGCEITLINNGSFTITLKEQSASSTAVNRFNAGGDISLTSNGMLRLVYDATATRWRVMGGTGGGGGGGGTVTNVTIADGLSGSSNPITTSGTIKANYSRQFMMPL